jgi:hypothetical protein
MEAVACPIWRGPGGRGIHGEVPLLGMWQPLARPGLEDMGGEFAKPGRGDAKAGRVMSMAGDRPIIPRGKYIGRPIDAKTGKPDEVSEAEHFSRCEACGAWVDRRDLGQAFGYEGELPHPAGDRDQ